jgi:transcriptional regulator of acetoin/glycerol metabolism
MQGVVSFKKIAQQLTRFSLKVLFQPIGENMYLQEKRQIDSARETFYHNPIATISEIRPEVLASWQRSWGYGVDPECVEKIVLAPKELLERIENNRALYESAVPALEDMHNYVKGSGFMCILTDNEGYVLKIIGDEDVINAAKTNLLVEGANRSERTFGTCGIGTCIHLQRPVQIWAGEHYYKLNNVWSGSAAPVFDENNCMAGVLCLCGFWDCVNFHTLGLVASAAKAASRQLMLENSRARIDNSSNKLDRVIEVLSYGIVFTRLDGAILRLNSVAARMLNPTTPSKDVMLGRNIREFLSKDGNAIETVEIRSGKTVAMNTVYGRFHCTFSFIRENAAEDEGEVVLTIRREQEPTQQSSRKFVGSHAKYTWNDLIGHSPAMEEAKRLARLAAPYPSNVLLKGQSGVGKEVFAQAIHNASARSHAPFVAINCGALPRSLIESELFGYEGGAFTGSRRDGQPGKFELANGGTIFLDEIGDMPRDVQVLLLRVLQTREVVRIGGRSATPVDVRVISATNKNLMECVRNGTFREDLYYRLNVFAIPIPPLKERNGDIRTLAEHILKKFSLGFEKSIVGFTEDAFRILEAHDWPGNLRELENAIERSILVCQGERITRDDLPGEIRKECESEPVEVRAECGKENDWASTDYYEEELIRRAVAVHKGNIKKIAQELGLGRTTLYRKLKKYLIEIDVFRNP